jgi:hypothetical protein
MRKVTITFFASLFTVALIGLTSAEGMADTYHPPMNSVPSGYLGVHVVDQIYWGQGASAVFADLHPINGVGDSVLCGGQSGIGCDFAALKAVDMRANLIMPKCETTAEENCIDTVSIYKEGTSAVPATYVRSVAGSTTNPDPALQLTRGGTSSLWESPGVKNSGDVATYSVIAQLNLNRNSADVPFSASSLNVMVMPYVEKYSESARPITWTQSTRSDQTHQIGTTGGNPDCAWVEDHTCGLVQDFSDGTRVQISLRLTKQIGGWFKGRMQNPEIAISSFSNSSNLVKLDGLFSKVPQFFTLLDRVNGPAELRSLVGLDTGAHPQGSGGGGTTSTFSDQQGAFQWVDKFRTLAKDTAAGVSTVWSAGTTSASQGPCLSDTSKVLGIVSTNSMVYEGSSPTFDGTSLNYKVAGLHYLPDGKTTAEGTYDLVMRSETARCLYRFSSAPISAAISVTSADGEAKVATTLVSEKDGWLKLSAYGFTFSENRISARITQVSKSDTNPKKQRIVCVRGKLTQKITSVAPKCPSGYKKKS